MIHNVFVKNRKISTFVTSNYCKDEINRIAQVGHCGWVGTVPNIGKSSYLQEEWENDCCSISWKQRNTKGYRSEYSEADKTEINSILH